MPAPTSFTTIATTATFDEIGMLAGVALGDDGQELGLHGVDFADYDHDGKLDLFVTNYYTDQINNLYRNLGGGTFSDVSWPAKLGQPSYRYVKWGAGFVDFDKRRLGGRIREQWARLSTGGRPSPRQPWLQRAHADVP